MSDLKQFANSVRERVNAFMAARIESLDDAAPELKEAMGYGLLLGGKRSRPLLVYATGGLLGAGQERLDYAAAAIECVHAYSLIHDDMPEMDNDTLRRGQPTVHARFSPATALLAGDALQTLGFEFASDPASGLKPEQRAELCRLLAVRAGYAGMCGGQAIDLASENQHIPLSRLKVLHSKKTGALIECAVLMGAACADGVTAETLQILKEYADLTGLAFQVWDDVLDVIGDTAVIGKNAGSDIEMGKSTYPALIGLDESKAYAREVADKAIAVLSRLQGDTSILAAFADFTVSRDH